MAIKNYAYIGKGIIKLQKSGGAAVDVGNASALSFAITEDQIKLPNYRTLGGGSYAAVSRISEVQVQMTLHDLSPENLAMVLFGTSTTANKTHTIEALVTGAQEFTMTFEGMNEANTGQEVNVTIHRVKIGATSDLGLIGDDFASLEVTGEVLLDSSITTEGLSQFFKIEIVDPD